MNTRRRPKQQSSDLLTEAWDRGDFQTVLNYINLFHGHPGPNAVIGFRAGLLGLRRVKANKYFGAKATYRGPCRPPESCLADGLQTGTGCTVGKASLLMEEAPEISLAVEHEETGERVTFRISEQVRAEIESRYARGMDESETSLWLMSLNDKELFRVS